ncbi:MAG: hypothetical protein H6862_05435 [Rhodospirillales bacterium]|nr:hypothetical protein [Rhodospirillales bacterium]
MRLAAVFAIVLGMVFIGDAAGRAARASESLSFSADINAEPMGRRALDLLTSAAPEVAAIRGSFPSVARGELNADGTPEIFLRLDFSPEFCPLGCTPLVFVFARHDESLRMIARFAAFQVRMADDVTSGVRDLMVYADPKNDFIWTRYVWTPVSHRYEPYRIDSRGLSVPSLPAPDGG